MEAHPTDDSDSVTEAFDLLGHRYRRHVVRALDENRHDLALADLADEPAERVYDDDLSDVPPENVSEIYPSLYHTHVPRPVDGDVVSYEQDRDIVTPRDRGERVVQTLDALQ